MVRDQSQKMVANGGRLLLFVVVRMSGLRRERSQRPTQASAHSEGPTKPENHTNPSTRHTLGRSALAFLTRKPPRNTQTDTHTAKSESGRVFQFQIFVA